jgi:ribosomal-protein-alanine N-acetyltransferase
MSSKFHPAIRKTSSWRGQTFLLLFPPTQPKWRIGAGRQRTGLERLGGKGMAITSQIVLGRDAPTRKEAAMHSEQKQEIRVHIRWMIRRDMAEVLQIERESFEYPWIDEDFIRCLRQRNCIGMIAEHEGRVVGFMIYELHRTRIHVLNFAVSRICQRLGVGSQMVAKLIAKLSAQRRSRIVLEVRETNVDAQLFFRENGFRAVSILHSFYDDTPEDAYLMQYRYRVEKPVEVDSSDRIQRRAA